MREKGEDLYEIYQRFPKVDYDEWKRLARIELGLDSKLSDLDWHIEEDIVISPLPDPPTPPTKTSKSDHHWRLAEIFRKVASDADLKKINQLQIDEIILDLTSFDKIPNLNLTKEPIKVSVILHREQIPEFHLSSLKTIFVFLNTLDQSIMNELHETATFDWRYGAASHSLAPSDQLISILKQIIAILELDQKELVAPGRYRAYLTLSDNYLVEISKIRALRIVLQNLWHTLQLPAKTCPPIYAQILLDETTDQNLTLVRATTQCMAAAIGGVDVLYFDSHQPEHSSDEDLRLRRNIHYILKYESHLDHRIDPLSGSYLIETLTQKLARKAWETIRGERQIKSIKKS